MLKTIVRYSLALFASNIVTGFLSFLSTMIVVRILSKEAFGLFNHYILVYSTIGSFFIAGVQYTIITFINQDQEKRYQLVESLLVTFVTITFPVFLFLSVGFKLFEGTVATCLGLLMVVPSVYVLHASLVYRAILNARGEIALRSSISILNSILTILILFVWKSEYAPIAADMISILLPMAVVLFLFFRCKNRRKVLINPFDSSLLAFWKATLPLWIAGFVFMINSKITQLFVDSLLGVEELAVLGFVYTIWTFITRPVEMIQRASLPVFSRVSAWNGEELTLLRINLTIFPFLGLLLILVIPWFLLFFHYDAYIGCEYYLIVLSITIPVFSVEFILSSMAMSIGRGDINRDVAMVAIVFNIPGSYFLISKFGIAGAFYAAVFYQYIYGLLLGMKLVGVLPVQAKYAFIATAKCMLIYFIAVVWIVLHKNSSLAVLSIAIFLSGAYIANLWRLQDIKVGMDVLKRPPSQNE